jgi:hypothetical protein
MNSKNIDKIVYGITDISNLYKGMKTVKRIIVTR